MIWCEFITHFGGGAISPQSNGNARLRHWYSERVNCKLDARQRMQFPKTRWLVVAMYGLGLFCGSTTGNAAQCLGNPNALGTSRVISVDPTEHARIGTMQYAESLPLADKEIVLTFDDGPLPPYTSAILSALASECVKATFFVVGNMARAYPNEVRRVYAGGHTIGTHSQSHPMKFDQMSTDRVRQEVETGIAMTAAALGNAKAVAPFFRIPGLARSWHVEAFLRDRELMTWSADFVGEDWRYLQASEILNRALQSIETKGRGILLLHDIKPATAQALPLLLSELKARGYRVVHVVPAGINHPKTVTAPQDWMLAPGSRVDWRRVASTSVNRSMPTPNSNAAATVSPWAQDQSSVTTQSIDPRPLAMNAVLPVRAVNRRDKPSPPQRVFSFFPLLPSN